MRWRPNQLSDLTNNFADDPSTVDQLPIKWPADGIRIDNSGWFQADEIAVMPTTNVVINSSHFNSYADGIAALQRFMQTNYGQTYTIDSTGGVTDCGKTNVPAQPAATILASSFYTAGDVLMATAVVTSEISFTMGATGDPYSFTATGEIPSAFGADPWASRNFGVFADSQIISNSSTVGIWSGDDYSKSKFDKIRAFNSIPQVYTMVTPVSGDPNAYKLWVRILTYNATGYSVGDPTWSSAYAWNFTKSLLNTQINTDSQSNFKAICPEGNGVTPFEVRHSTTPVTSSLYGIEPVSGSLSFLQVNCTMTSPSTSLGLSPYLGGFIFHKSQEGQKERNVGVQFMWHGWLDAPFPYDGFTYEDELCYALKSGIFLRLKKHNTPKSITDAKTYPQYEGYLLRFTGAPSGEWADGTGTWDYRENVGTWAILKVRYEDFTNSQVSSSSIVTQTPISAFDNYYHDEVGTNASGYQYSNNVPGEYQILATGEVIRPVINRGSSGASADSWPLGNITNDRYEYKFEVVEDTVYLYQRTSSIASWTLLASALDSSPILPEADTEYWPSGFFSMPTQNHIPATGLHTYGPMALLFSNIITYVVKEPTSNTISCRLIFTKTSGQDSSPDMS